MKKKFAPSLSLIPKNPKDMPTRDTYIAKYVIQIKKAKTTQDLFNIVDSIYNDGYNDGADSVEFLDFIPGFTKK